MHTNLKRSFPTVKHMLKNANHQLFATGRAEPDLVKQWFRWVVGKTICSWESHIVVCLVLFGQWSRYVCMYVKQWFRRWRWKYRNWSGNSASFRSNWSCDDCPRGWMMVVVTLDNCYHPLGKSCGLLLNPDLHKWKIPLNDCYLPIDNCYLSFVVSFSSLSLYTSTMHWRAYLMHPDSGFLRLDC